MYSCNCLLSQTKVVFLIISGNLIRQSELRPRPHFQVDQLDNHTISIKETEAAPTKGKTQQLHIYCILYVQTKQSLEFSSNWSQEGNQVTERAAQRQEVRVDG